MKIVFFGTSSFAANVLSDLLEHHFPVVAIVTRPDRQKGRSLHTSAPPVKEVASRLAPDLPIHQPEKASSEVFAEVLKTYQADLFVVVAFGEIIKQNLLNMPSLGCINIHASLLPKYRGAAPMQRALMDGVSETGITIIDMVLEMDAGDILAIEKIPVPQEVTFGELEEKLCSLACHMLKKVIEQFKNKQISKIPQDPLHVTFAPKITPKEEQIDWNKSAHEIHNLIRALSPRPGAWSPFLLGGSEKRLKITRSLVVESSAIPPGSTPAKLPGDTLYCEKGEWIVACGKDALRVLEVQLEGKKGMPVKEFLRGIPPSSPFSIKH